MSRPAIKVLPCLFCGTLAQVSEQASRYCCAPCALRRTGRVFPVDEDQDLPFADGEAEQPSGARQPGQARPQGRAGWREQSQKRGARRPDAA